MDERRLLLERDMREFAIKRRRTWFRSASATGLLCGSLMWFVAEVSRERNVQKMDTKKKRQRPVWEQTPDYTFRLELMYIGLQVDGKQKNVLSFNGAGAQGPTLRVPVNSVVRVEVVNLLGDQGATVHFHGIAQLGTPFFDGAHGVSQAAIPPMGGAMTYQFLAWPAGTHWYHSHLALQYADGAKGMLVVYDDEDGLAPYYDAERYVMFYDWLPKMSSMEYYVLGQVYGNSMHVMATDNDMVDWVPAAGLVNGEAGLRGDALGNSQLETDLGYVLEMPVGHTLRVRLCFGGWLDKAAVRVEGHDVLAVAKDGVAVRPVQTSSIMMHPGERFDVLLRARPDARPGDEFGLVFEFRDHAQFPVDKLNRKPDDWTSGARPFFDDPDLLVFTHKRGLLNATLRYVAAPAASRVVAPLEPWQPDAITDLLDASRDTFSSNAGNARLALDTTKARPPPRAAPSRGRAVLPVVLGGGYHNPTTGEWVMPHSEKITEQLLESVGARPMTVDGMPLATRVVSNNFWCINNNSWVDPSVPLYISKGKFGRATAAPFSTLVYDVPHDGVVDLVVVAHGNAGVIETHPFHLHGQHFWVVFTAKMPILPLSDIDDLGDRVDGLDLDLDTPPFVDTYPVTTGYYYVFRFLASNPGMWHFHCHFLMHGVAGMQMVLNVRQDEQPAPPRIYYDGQDLSGALCPPSREQDRAT